MTEATLSLHEQQLDDILNRVKILDEKTYEVDGEKVVVYQQQPHQIHLAAFADFGSNQYVSKDRY